MSETSAHSRSRQRLLALATIGATSLAIAVGIAWYLRSQSFEQLVRRKVITYLEKATNGRVELGAFHWNISRLEIDARGLTIHGREAPDEMPFVHVNRLYARLHIISLAEARVNLRELRVDRPVFHLIIYPDGTTNAPELEADAATKTPVQQLFDLAIRRADFRRGMFVLNQREWPLDFGLNDVDARMVYDSRNRRYDGKIDVGKLDASYRDWRDIPAQGSLDFSLWQDAVELKALKLRSQKSSVEISGKLENLRNPRVQLYYNSDLDLAQVGAVIRNSGLRNGSLSVTGSGQYADAAYSSTGRVAVRGLDYIQQSLNLHGTSLDTDFSIDRNRLTLTRIAVRMLGGEITGNAEVKNYGSGTVPTGNGARNEVIGSTKKTPAAGQSRVTKGMQANGQPVERGTAHLQVRNLSLAEVARVFSTKSMPLMNLRPVGAVAGTAELRWTGSLRRGEGDLALEVTPPLAPAANDLPITASVRGRYSAASGVIGLSSARVATPRTQLQAIGDLGSRTAALKLTIATTSLTELQPLLSAMGNKALPIELAGQASFTGTLNGRLRSPEIGGHLQAVDFTYIYTPEPAPAVRPVRSPARRSLFQQAPAPLPPQPAPVSQPRRIHIDSVSADVLYSSSGISVRHGVIRQENAQANVDGSASLENGSFTPASPFHVQAAVHNADVGALQRLLGIDYPVNGMLNLTMQASGTEQDPQGQGQIALRSAAIHGRAVKALTTKIVFANHEARVNDLELQALGGVVHGSAAYNLTSKTGRFELRGESIELSEIPELQTPRLTASGVANFSALGSGSFDAPDITAHLTVDKLVINSEVEGGLVLDAVTHGPELQLAARSKFPKATLALDGKVELRGEMPADFTLQFRQLDIDPLLHAELRGRITGHSSMAGQARLAGPLRQPRYLTGTLKIDAFKVEVEKIPLASDGPVELTLQDQRITAQRCTFISEDSRLALVGSVELRDDRPLDLRASGQVNVKLLQTLNPDITSYGTTEVDLRLRGTVATPVMVGHINVSHVSLSMTDLPAGLSDLNGSLVFNQNRLEIEHLTGRTGGGRVAFNGFVVFGTAIGFDLAAQGGDIRFRFAGVSVTSDLSLHLMGSLQNSSLTGDITVTRFAQVPSADLTLMLARRNEPAVTPNPNSPLNNLHLDVRILSAPELTVQTSLAKLSGDVDLRLRGTPLKPVLLGRINIAEGDIKFNGAKYHLERGDITFADPVRIDPILDVEATTHVRDYDITIGLHGTMEKLTTTYRSDPPLSSDDIIALLAFGRTQQESNMSATIPNLGFAQSASNAVLGQALSGTVGNRVSKLFGVSSIRINPSVGGPNNNPNARLTVEQQVSDNVTITYITNLSQSAQQVIQFEYNINPQYTFVAMRDENGVVSFDLLVRKRRK